MIPDELVQALAQGFGVSPAAARAALDEDARVAYDLGRRNRRLRARAALIRYRWGHVPGIEVRVR